MQRTKSSIALHCRGAGRGREGHPAVWEGWVCNRDEGRQQGEGCTGEVAATVGSH